MRLYRILITAALAVVTVVGAFGRAEAGASGCSSSVGATIGIAWCQSGTYRVRLVCKHVDGTPNKIAYGPWRNAMDSSEASCRPFGAAYRAWYATVST